MRLYDLQVKMGKIEEEIIKFKVDLGKIYKINEDNLIYLRLSKLDNSIKDVENQVKDALNKLRADFNSILETYPNLNEEGFLLFVEVKSAYKDSIREEFINLYENYLFKDISSIKNILERNNIKSTKKLYIKSFDRLSRVFLYSLSFHLITILTDIKIYSVLEEEKALGLESQDIMNKSNQDQLMFIFKLMLNSSNAQRHSEDLSNKISNRVTKDSKGVTISSKTGNKWGVSATISEKMKKRINDRYIRFSAKEIAEQKDIFQIVDGKKKPISVNTIYSIVKRDSK